MGKQGVFYSASTGVFYPAETGVVPPSDAVEISEELHAELLANQAQGKPIVPASNGYPISSADSGLSADDLIKQHIVELEAQQTPRRIREAVLGVDGGWLAGIEAQIEALRSQLGGS